MHFQKDTIFDFPLVNFRLNNGELECDDTNAKQMLQFLFDRIDDLQTTLDNMEQNNQYHRSNSKSKVNVKCHHPPTLNNSTYHPKLSKAISKNKGPSLQTDNHLIKFFDDDSYNKEVQLRSYLRRQNIDNLLDDIDISNVQKVKDNYFSIVL
ncbi:hypothetical protein QTN25_002042 [Entamoeba marina]